MLNRDSSHLFLIRSSSYASIHLPSSLGSYGRFLSHQLLIPGFSYSFKLDPSEESIFSESESDTQSDEIILEPSFGSLLIRETLQI